MVFGGDDGGKALGEITHQEQHTVEHRYSGITTQELVRRTKCSGSDLMADRRRWSVKRSHVVSAEAVLTVCVEKESATILSGSYSDLHVI